MVFHGKRTAKKGKKWKKKTRSDKVKLMGSKKDRNSNKNRASNTKRTKPDKRANPKSATTGNTNG